MEEATLSRIRKESSALKSATLAPSSVLNVLTSRVVKSRTNAKPSGKMEEATPIALPVQ